MKQINASVLISTYNWPEALDLVFQSILIQTIMPKEIVIADDGSGIETKQLIESYQPKLLIPIKHVWHEDKGFRKTLIMNKAIKQIEGDYIIQIDGDILLNPYFIEDHIKNAKEGYFIRGSRGMLTAQKSYNILKKTKKIRISPFDKGLLSKINGTRLPCFSSLFYGKPNSSRKVKGCNFAFWKKDFINVNGYNNALMGWGHEDIELAARLVNMEIKCKQLKMVAVCYHLYHPLNSRQQEESNLQVYEKVINEGIKKCSNGYWQID